MDHPLTLVEHLGELRKRIIAVFIALGLATIFSVPFAPFIIRILKYPARGTINRLAFFSPEEGFLIYFRVSLFAGLVISMPVILYELWKFVSPAIDERLQKKALNFVASCTLLFVTGCLFAYFWLIPPALKFLLGFAKLDLEPVISAQKYISFITGLTLGCGFVFQMPVLSFILAKVGVINHRILRKKYKYAVVVIFIVAAIITPTPDAFNMLLLAGPMLLLYELSIWVARFSGKIHPHATHLDEK